MKGVLKMEEQKIYETTEGYEVVDDNDFELDTYDGECSDEKDDIMKYIGVAAAAIGAFALIQKGVKAIGKKIKSKKKTEDERPKKKVDEDEIIDVEEDELEVVEDDCEDIIEDDIEETPKKKKKK